MVDATRRHLLKSGAVGALGFLAGCLDSEQQRSPSTEQQQSPSNEQQQSPSNQDVSPEDLLPVEKDGWTLEDTWSGTMDYLGGKDSIWGDYKSPNNTIYDVVIMEVMDVYVSEGQAKDWKCDAGWTVALGYNGFAIVAGTGTVQRTFTPEAPPHLNRTPIPETREMTKELLSNSPVLSRQMIDEFEVTDEDCRR